ncbi:hypothetical protein [Piscinibacter sp. XHJ-5]|uniref:hypothetical protein n=1 Tax=Piscinibacter sp. XHJ-5 TaxID=3037797 RepID=UPI0024536B82|nr:hypothetical protein [Piscinibacter sp. XHJ-5]
MNTKNDRPLAKGEQRARDENRDPLSGAPGSHPVGTGLGAAAGGLAAGAAVGTAAGPIGTAIGAAIGAVAGGLAGKGVAELVDPTAEDAYWRKTYSSRPYVDPTYNYDDYGPAYRYGLSAYSDHPGRAFDDVESDIGAGWDRARGSSRLTWEHAKEATRDAWERVGNAVERAVPGDSDRDGR